MDGITVLDDGATAANTEPSDSDSDSDSDSAPDSDSDAPAQAVPPTPSRSNKASKAAKGAAHPTQQHSQQEAELQDFQDAQERREEMKQQMAVTASKLLQNPEANLPSMRSLLTLAADKDSQVSHDSNISLSSCPDHMGKDTAHQISHVPLPHGRHAVTCICSHASS